MANRHGQLQQPKGLQHLADRLPQSQFAGRLFNAQLPGRDCTQVSSFGTAQRLNDWWLEPVASSIEPDEDVRIQQITSAAHLAPSGSRSLSSASSSNHSRGISFSQSSARNSIPNKFCPHGSGFSAFVAVFTAINRAIGL